MGSKNLVEKTTNRKVFNRAYKAHLEHRGKIGCSYCRYHRGENDSNKWYGGLIDEISGKYHIRYPNWKLVSKNRKQWMKKPIRIVEETSNFNKRTYVEIKFSA